jgi:uncharacterized protein YheU (UPF0270 family)
MTYKTEQSPAEIPLEVLSPEALAGIMDNFINREGTDYGQVEMPYEKKMENVKQQLVRGDIKIVFDPNTESVTLLTQRDWKKYEICK